MPETGVSISEISIWGRVGLPGSNDVVRRIDDLGEFLVRYDPRIRNLMC